MDQSKARKWFLKCIGLLAASLLLLALIVIVTDPSFHYHKPYPFMSYRLYDERYTNDGISRHFDFDALITGTSMAQNFRPSQMDALFGTHSVKETFSGAGYQELADNLARALERNPSLRTVLLGLDSNGLLRDYDWKQYDNYPTYLYDDNPFNDVSYLFNKSIFYHGVLTSLAMTLSGSPATTMDEYSSWQRPCGLEAILGSYDRDALLADSLPANSQEGSAGFGEKEHSKVVQTITLNVLDIVNQYPDTVFYIFFPPYSICYWDAAKIQNTLNQEISAMETAADLLLACPNVRLYSFFGQYDVICNLDNYSDIGHYSGEINSQILEWMAEGTGLLTKENYRMILSRDREFFLNYDYGRLYN